jgi:UDP-glucose 4-epimerase
MTLANRLVLITGGAGFVGSHITSQLIDLAELTILDDFSVGNPAAIPDGVRVIKEDVRNREAILNCIADVDIIFHQAGLVSVSQSIQSPYESHSINATGTVNILDAARRCNAKVVVASSAAVYGNPDYTPIDEEHPFAPTSPYGLDKLVTDRYTRIYANLYDLETVSLRYFNVFGPGQTRGDYAGVIPIFIVQALSGKDITIHGDGEQTRDFVYVEDVARANISAAQTATMGEAYNIATGDSISVRELAEKIHDITDSSSDIVHTTSRSGDIEHSAADVSKATAALGYEPSITLEEGLAQTVSWWQNRNPNV